MISARRAGYSVATVGAALVVVAEVEDSLPLSVVGCIIALIGLQTLLWSGSLAEYPRKRACAITASILAGLLATILIAIRLYAGPEAWSG